MNRPNLSDIDGVIKEFKNSLRSKRDQDTFKITTLGQLRASIAEIQSRQHAARRLQNLNRLTPFLKAAEQYGEIVSLFSNNNEIMAFIWGPMKFLLETTSSSKLCDRAFSELLDVYEQTGEALPLLSQYEDFFRSKPQRVKILSLIYKEITSFHHIALEYFQRRAWETLFNHCWQSYRSQLLRVSSNITQHRIAIENQSSTSQTTFVESPRPVSTSQSDLATEESHLQRRMSVCHWLSAIDPAADQERFSRIRADYAHAGTGRWLFDNQTFKEWFDPRFVTIPPLVRLTGLPGAGKTILTSRIVEEAQNLTPPPRVLFFYCKQNPPGQNTFVALARSFLLQFLQQDKGLLMYLHSEYCNSTERVLSSSPVIKKMLEFAFGACQSAYIIIDGLDECERDERKNITQWFRSLVESLPVSAPDRLRCIFVSQDDRVGENDLHGIAKINIEIEDNKPDILAYSRVESDKLREKFKFSDEESDRIAVGITDSVKGIFLLATLVWINLLEQTTVAEVAEQLRDFPDEINDAYERIMDRIIRQASRPMRNSALKLLGWLVCAKRPLRWSEIQSLKSITVDEQCVDFARYEFRNSGKELCGSLVELQPDGTLELIHITAKIFLIDNARYIDVVAKELEFACICIDYLNLPAFTTQPTNERVLNGDYGFMEYAILNWTRHLEAGTSNCEGDEAVIAELAGSLETFIRNHWKNPTAKLAISKGTKKNLKYFRHLSFHDQLEQSVASWKRQLRRFEGIRDGEVALNLVDIVHNVRQILEDTVASTSNTSALKTIEERYGNNLFKCPRLSCQFFIAGFTTPKHRQEHLEKHIRPFRCPDEGCTGFMFGFSLKKDWDKHMKTDHVGHANHHQEFPTDEDVAQSMQDGPVTEQATLTPEISPEQQTQMQSDSNPHSEPETDSESELEAEIQQPLFSVRPPRQQQFKCPHCPNLYTKKHNFTSHLLSHTDERPFRCGTCADSFGRKYDLRRHEETHKEKRYVCRGVLKNGAIWGCGTAFGRADTLKKHHKSEVGQKCVLPFHQEEELEGLP